jgi:hypothetical protein
MAIEKLRRNKSPSIDQIPTELIKAGCRTIHSAIHKLINSIRNKEDLSKQWREPIIVPIYKKDDKRDSSNCRGMPHLSTMRRKLMGFVNFDFDRIGKLLIIYFDFVKKQGKNRNALKQCISYLHIKKFYDKVRREALGTILIEFGIPMKLVRLIKCL